MMALLSGANDLIARFGVGRQSVSVADRQTELLLHSVAR